MTTEQIIGFSLALLVMFIGLLGSFLPALPSTPIVLAAAVGHRLYFGPAGPSVAVLVIMLLMMLFAMLLDFLASVVGAKKMGATWRGVVGAALGAIVGLFFSLPGIILGPFIGAFLFELMGQREFNDALKAGVGATLGVFVGALGKMACCVVMIVLFAMSVISHSGTPRYSIGGCNPSNSNSGGALEVTPNCFQSEGLVDELISGLAS